MSSPPLLQRILIHVKCTRCGCVHYLMSREEAEADIDDFNSYYETLSAEDKLKNYRNTPSSMASYKRCRRCGISIDEDDNNFVLGGEDTVPKGCTIQPLVSDHLFATWHLPAEPHDEDEYDSSKEEECSPDPTLHPVPLPIGERIRDPPNTSNKEDEYDSSKEEECPPDPTLHPVPLRERIRDSPNTERRERQREQEAEERVENDMIEGELEAYRQQKEDELEAFRQQILEEL